MSWLRRHDHTFEYNASRSHPPLPLNIFSSIVVYLPRIKWTNHLLDVMANVSRFLSDISKVVPQRIISALYALSTDGIKTSCPVANEQNNPASLIPI